MPSADAILWAAIGGMILLMLGIIGYLIDKGGQVIQRGFDELKAELKTIWEKVDRHQDLAETNAQRITAMEARCDERHANHKRRDD